MIVDVHAQPGSPGYVTVAKDFRVVSKLVVNGSQISVVTNYKLVLTTSNIRLTWPLLPIVCQAITLPATGATFKPSLENVSEQ